MNEVVKNLNIQKMKVDNQEKSYRCEECGDILRKKKDLKLHVKENHPKYIRCDYCDDNFKESWQYETQLKLTPKPRTTNVMCVENVSFWTGDCHYYNNKKVCPFDAIGCKFNHKISKECENQVDCRIKLCSRQHSKRDVIMEHSEQ